MLKFKNISTLAAAALLLAASSRTWPEAATPPPPLLGLSVHFWASLAEGRVSKQMMSTAHSSVNSARQRAWLNSVPSTTRESTAVAISFDCWMSVKAEAEMR